MRKLSSILNSAFVETINSGGLQETPLVSAVNRAESPIEAQLMMHVMRYDFVIGEDKGLTYIEACALAQEFEGRIFCFQQVWVEDFRVDFMFVRWLDGRATMLVVEADGKDWHYSNEGQIMHDNNRMATFATCRIFTMRFLGREIWKECEAVIGRVRRFFEAAA